MVLESWLVSTRIDSAIIDPKHAQRLDTLSQVNWNTYVSQSSAQTKQSQGSATTVCTLTKRHIGKEKTIRRLFVWKKMYAYQHYNNPRTVLHIKLWPAIRKLNLFSVINDPNWIVSTDLACIGTNARKYVLVSKKKIVYSDESIRIFPTLRPRDERVTLPVIPHLKVIASK